MEAGPDSQPNAGARKPYETPALKAYGSILEITQANAHTSPTGDNATKRNSKTGG